MDLIKYDMTDIWASAGDVVAPDSTKVKAGWGVEVVPRQWWNWFENRQDNNIAYMLQKGFPEWDATTQYIINKSYVQRNGVVYKATLTSLNSDPMELTSWIRAFADYSTSSAALGALTPVANQLPYFNGTSTATTTTLSPFARTILDDADDATVRATISAQQSNVNLTTFSGVTAAPNGLPYFTGTTAMGTTSLTSFGRSLIDDTDAATARATLGVTSSADSTAALSAGLATKQDLNANLTALSSVTSAANKLAYFTGTGTATTTDLTVFSRSLLANADAASSRSTLGVDSSITSAANLASGLATKQPINTNLTAWSSLTPLADTLSYWTSGTVAASTAFTSFGRTLLSQADALSARTAIGADNATNLTTGTIPLARIPTSLTGVNSATSTKLATARTIQGVAFDGTANITLPVVPLDSSTGAAYMPVGSTSARPTTPAVGMIRYNSDNQTFEGYQGSAWSTVGGAGLPVGSLVPWNVSEASVPFGWLPRSGGLYNRADYPDLWLLVQSLVISDADWISTPANRGKYSSGNGTTTFRMPDDNGKYDNNGFGAVTLRGYGKNSTGTLGLHQQDQLQGFATSVSTGPAGGSLGGISSSARTDSVGFPLPGVKVSIVSDGTNGTPRFGSETRMSNTTVIWCTVAAGKVNNIGNIDINVLNTTVNTHTAQISSLQSTKVETSSPLVAKAFARFAGGTSPSILNGSGFASISRSSVGNFLITTSNPYPNATTIGTINQTVNYNQSIAVVQLTDTTFQVVLGNNNTAVDFSNFSVLIFRT